MPPPPPRKDFTTKNTLFFLDGGADDDTDPQANRSSNNSYARNYNKPATATATMGLQQSNESAFQRVVQRLEKPIKQPKNNDDQHHVDNLRLQQKQPTTATKVTIEPQPTRSSSSSLFSQSSTTTTSSTTKLSLSSTTSPPSSSSPSIMTTKKSSSQPPASSTVAANKSTPPPPPPPPSTASTESPSAIGVQHRRQSKIPRFSSPSSASRLGVDAMGRRTQESRETIGTIAVKSSKQSPPSTKLTTAATNSSSSSPTKHSLLASPTKIPTPATTSTARSSFSAYRKPGAIVDVNSLSPTSTSIFLNHDTTSSNDDDGSSSSTHTGRRSHDHQPHAPPTPTATSSIFRYTANNTKNATTKPSPTSQSQSATASSSANKSRNSTSNVVTKLFQPTIPFVQYPQHSQSHSQQNTITDNDDASSTSSDKPIAQDYLKSIQQPLLSSQSSSSVFSNIDDGDGDASSQSQSQSVQSQQLSPTGNNSSRQIKLFQTPAFQSALHTVRKHNAIMSSSHHVGLDAVARVPSDEVLFAAPSPVFFEDQEQVDNINTPKTVSTTLKQQQQSSSSSQPTRTISSNGGTKKTTTTTTLPQEQAYKTFDGDDSMLEEEEKDLNSNHEHGSVEVSLLSSSNEKQDNNLLDDNEEPGRIHSRRQSSATTTSSSSSHNKRSVTWKQATKNVSGVAISISNSFMTEESEHDVPAVFEDRSESNLGDSDDDENNSDEDDNRLLPGSSAFQEGTTSIPSWAKIMQGYATSSSLSFDAQDQSVDDNTATEKRTSMTIVRVGDADIPPDIDPRVLPPKETGDRIDHDVIKVSPDTARAAAPADGDLVIKAINSGTDDVEQGQAAGDELPKETKEVLDWGSFSITQKVIFVVVVAIMLFLIIFAGVWLSRDNHDGNSSNNAPTMGRDPCIAPNNNDVQQRCICDGNARAIIDGLSATQRNAYNSVLETLRRQRVFGDNGPPAEDSCSSQHQAILHYALQRDLSTLLTINDMLELYALMVLFIELDGRNWTNNDGWLSGDLLNYCEWWGVTCLLPGTLSELNLRSNDLRGSLPSEIGLWTELRSINLADNIGLNSTIPSELGLLASLNLIDFSHTPFRGSLPTTIGLLSELQHIRMADSHIVGSIPSEIVSLDLVELDLRGNNLEGSIPTWIGLATNLELLFLQRNMLSSTIPSELSRLNNLEVLHLAGNAFRSEDSSSTAGTFLLPRELGGNLTQLSYVNVLDTGLKGSIPESFCSRRSQERRIQWVGDCLNQIDLRCSCCADFDYVCTELLSQERLDFHLSRHR